MRKTTLLIAATAVVLGSCNQTKQPVETAQEGREALRAALHEIQEDSTLSDAEFESAYYGVVTEFYDRHHNDSLAIELFNTLVNNVWDNATAQTNYAKADTLVQNNERVQHYMRLSEARAKTSAGAAYVDIAGPDVLDDSKQLSISSTLADGKPVLVDFFASWCPPCRRAINNELPGLKEKYSGKLNILGIDVWENKKEDIDKAMGELPITWPVIYTGGRDSSPAYLYGVQSIPTVVLLSADGTILARSHSLNDIMPELEKAIGE